MHTAGWPLDSHTDGGGFLYHADNNRVFAGFIVSLGYKNPHLSPFNEFQRWKTHPKIRRYLDGGKRIAYGARAVNKGGLQSLPKLTFPGGMLVGCTAGFLNGAKIKGAHTAIKTGMLAAESVQAALQSDSAASVELTDFEDKVKSSWVYEELYRGRNFGPGLAKFGNFWGAAFAFIDQNIFFGKLPFTWHKKDADHEALQRASEAKVIDYPKPDGKLTFDRLSSVFLSSTNHEEDQPSHLKLKDAAVPITYNLPEFDEPAQRYCPAGVYEVVEEDGSANFRSMLRIACTARPATSRIRSRTSSGLCPRAAAARTTPICSVVARAQQTVYFGCIRIAPSMRIVSPFINRGCRR